MSLSSRNRRKGDAKEKEGRVKREKGGGKRERGREGKETNHVPVSSLRQVFAAMTWSAGPPATHASPETKWRSVLAVNSENQGQFVDVCF